jgi:type III secretion protein Q
VDEIPVKLVFEIGATQMLLGQLRQLQPGFTVALDEPLDMKQPVTIKANGVVVGAGEMVLIDDRLGVRILDFKDDSQPAGR